MGKEGRKEKVWEPRKGKSHRAKGSSFLKKLCPEWAKGPICCHPLMAGPQAAKFIA